MNRNGISVIICCYNSSRRIVKALNGISMQKFHKPLNWEIILVDNACTDDTVEKAKEIWEKSGYKTELKIVTEERPGLGFARQAGLAASQYKYLLFCDDDNWLCNGYLEKMYDNLEQDQNLAACGGFGIPFFEDTKPDWFDTYSEAFAVGEQNKSLDNGRLTMLYGAGIGIRKRILIELQDSGFKPWLQGRTGMKLSSAEDTELTYAFVLMGYRLSFDAQLQFQHYMPKERLTRDYLKRLFSAFGSDGPIRNVYYASLTNRRLHKLVKFWGIHMGLSIFRLLKYFVFPPKKSGRMIYLNWNIAYIKSLIALKPTYNELKKDIARLKYTNQNRRMEVQPLITE